MLFFLAKVVPFGVLLTNLNLIPSDIEFLGCFWASKNQILSFFHDFLEFCSYSYLFWSNLMGSTAQMASIALNAKPRGPLDAKNCFKNVLKDIRNLKMASKMVKFLDFLPIIPVVVTFLQIWWDQQTRWPPLPSIPSLEDIWGQKNALKMNWKKSETSK